MLVDCMERLRTHLVFLLASRIIEYIRLIALGTLVLLLSKNAYGFKIETHVWLVNQIAEEIEQNNKAVIINGRSYPLDLRIGNAIVLNRGAFVMGVMGADIYPDMFAGQMTTHPCVNKLA